MDFGSDFFDFFSNCTMAGDDRTEKETPKQDLERELNEMYMDYLDYLNKLDHIKEEGYKVLRNSLGQHKIIER